MRPGDAVVVAMAGAIGGAVVFAVAVSPFFPF
jgi:hypothetical protein